MCRDPIVCRGGISFAYKNILSIFCSGLHKTQLSSKGENLTGGFIKPDYPQKEIKFFFSFQEFFCFKISTAPQRWVPAMGQSRFERLSRKKNLKANLSSVYKLSQLLTRYLFNFDRNLL